MLRIAIAASAILALAFAASPIPKPDGTCGYQCIVDGATCPGCGSAGRCSCPDTGLKYPEISCSCVSAPANPPTSPPVDVNDTVWPDKWTANVSAWSYGDFSDKTAQALGKFYYDGPGGHSRGDWTPYINGKDATQVWINTPGKSSNYYVKTGPVCIYFPISDPGQNKAPVSVERADWMRWCNQSGFAKYVGREQVDGLWADHWSCHIEYEQVNQSITFQNWHSLGLTADVPKGLPVRVTGGNSAPNPTKGSPRLNSVWYSNFVTGDDAVKPSDFEKPSWACIPVMMEQSQISDFFGTTPTKEHLFSAEFHKRAHWAPHMQPTDRDTHRAQSKPKHVLGKNFGDAMQKLNEQLLAQPGLQTRRCSEFSLDQLEEAQQLLHEAKSPVFEQIYTSKKDTRALRLNGRSVIEKEFVNAKSLVEKRPELHAMVRDGLCHETVMLYMHHLSETAREEVRQLVTLPLMPPTQHAAPVNEDADAMTVHATYTTQVSCAVCHVM